MNKNGEELEIISCCDDSIEDLNAEPGMVEDQNEINLPKNDMKQPIVRFSSYNVQLLS